MRRVGWLLGGALSIALVSGCQGKGAEKGRSEQERGADKGLDGSSSAEASVPGDEGGAGLATRSCPEGMAHLSGGRFLQGSERGPDALTLDERPARELQVGGFCLDKSEVTVEAYAACVDAGACTKAKDKSPPYAWADQFNWGKAERKNHPVNGVSFGQARSYCEHVGKRLPTEAEWEFAARGTQNRARPWGDGALSAKLLNVCDTACRAVGKQHHLPWIAIFEESDGFAYTAPVGSFPAGATPDGIVDLEGNVSEWTEGAACPYENPACGVKGSVYRGSSWLDQFPGLVRSSARHKDSSGEGAASIGFRCAK